MSTRCTCGHDMDTHNDKPHADPIVTGWFGGNCRMCKCEEFTRTEKDRSSVDMARCEDHQYIHISDWGCPFCYRDKHLGNAVFPESQEPNDDVNDYDLRHLNTQIDKLQRVLGEIYLLSQKDIENGRWEAYNDERRLRRVNVLARKTLYDD